VEAGGWQGLETIDFRQTMTLKFAHSSFEQEARDPSAVQEYVFSDALSTKRLYEQFVKTRYIKRESHFTQAFVNLDKRAQFLLVVDCSDESVIRLCFIERYSILNKAVPALNLSYGQGHACQLKYTGRVEGGFAELLRDVSGSF